MVPLGKYGSWWERRAVPTTSMVFMFKDFPGINPTLKRIKKVALYTVNHRKTKDLLDLSLISVPPHGPYLQFAEVRRPFSFRDKRVVVMQSSKWTSKTLLRG